MSGQLDVGLTVYEIKSSASELVRMIKIGNNQMWCKVIPKRIGLGKNIEQLKSISKAKIVYRDLAKIAKIAKIVYRDLG